MFTEPKSEDLSTLLKDLIVPRVDSNPPRRLTLGIKQLHAEIIANKNFKASNFSFKQKHSDDTGRLLFGESTPLLGKRYRLLETIGEGTFSQIFKASDLQGSRTVAIKVMQIGLDLLGIRESTLLRYFASKTLRGSKHFVEVIETFRFEDHVCIALELCDCTLYNFLRIPTIDVDTNIKPINRDKEQFINGEKFILHSPKAKYCDRNVIDRDSLQSYNLDFTKYRKIATSLVSALCIMRKEGAIHADIKPENCFLTWSRGGKKSITTTATSDMSINDLPSDFDVRLGDFGNSIHISEASKYYHDFEIQTLSYRAPEVLFGVPFGPQIDVWSLGILLLELCLRKPLFIVRSREELLKSMEMKLSTPKLLRFAGGMYSNTLMNNNESIVLPRTNFPQHMLSVKRLLAKAIADVPADFVHFLAGMLHPDPDLRLTALDALQHPFLSSSLPIPMYLLNTKSNQRGAAAVGIASLRSKFSNQISSSYTIVKNEIKQDNNEITQKRDTIALPITTLKSNNHSHSDNNSSYGNNSTHKNNYNNKNNNNNNNNDDNEDDDADNYHNNDSSSNNSSTSNSNRNNIDNNKRNNDNNKHNNDNNKHNNDNNKHNYDNNNNNKYNDSNKEPTPVRVQSKKRELELLQQSNDIYIDYNNIIGTQSKKRLN